MRHIVWQTGLRIAGVAIAGGCLFAGVWAAQAGPAAERQTAGQGAGSAPMSIAGAALPARADAPAHADPPVPEACVPLWGAVPSPGYGPLVGVAAAGANDVWAISDSTVLHWDGQGWSPTPTATPATSPTPTPTPNLNAGYGARHYHGLAARASNDVWTSGHVDAWPIYNPSAAFISHFDGTAWHDVYFGSPTRREIAPGGGSIIDSTFYAVAPVGAGEAWAVGRRDNYGQPSGTLAAHCTPAGCDHVGATIDPGGYPPSPKTLRAVASSAPDDVWAVGANDYVSGGSLIVHWNGSAWAQVPAPDIGRLTGVTAPARDDAWAVSSTAMIHWDGSAWTVVPGVAGAVAIAAHGGDDIWAVSSTIRHWDGQGWQTVAAPASSYAAVSILATVEVWAAGSGPGGGGLVARAVPPPAFADVPVSQPFFTPIQTLACHDIVSGYACGAPGEPCPGVYYRPGATITRGQVAKMVALSAGLSAPPTRQQFADVPPSHPFYTWIGQLAGQGIVSGYTCGGPGEPCIAPGNLPYFRPGAPVTRGQFAKIVALAAGYADPPAGQAFADVPPGQPFYRWIAQVARRGIISGYTCGGPGEPCIGPANLPYFRPAATASRGQVAKIAALAFFP
jgi:hypothetical protein